MSSPSPSHKGFHSETKRVFLHNTEFKVHSINKTQNFLWTGKLKIKGYNHGILRQQYADQLFLSLHMKLMDLPKLFFFFCCRW